MQWKWYHMFKKFKSSPGLRLTCKKLEDITFNINHKEKRKKRKKRSSKRCHKTGFDSQLINRAEEKWKLGPKIKCVRGSQEYWCKTVYWEVTNTGRKQHMMTETIRKPLRHTKHFLKKETKFSSYWCQSLKQLRSCLWFYTQNHLLRVIYNLW